MLAATAPRLWGRMGVRRVPNAPEREPPGQGAILMGDGGTPPPDLFFLGLSPALAAVGPAPPSTTTFDGGVGDSCSGWLDDGLVVVEGCVSVELGTAAGIASRFGSPSIGVELGIQTIFMSRGG